MNKEFLQRLRCPVTGQSLSYRENITTQDNTNGDFLVSEDGTKFYPVINQIPRFVDATNYADNFGRQWNKFRLTQLDSHSGHPISANRFWKATGWTPAELEGKWVLDIGCGAGRFAEIALNAGAKVIALDYSGAVDACIENFNYHPNLFPVQGNIYELPFEASSFEYIYSLGVLQHTPDVEKAFKSLPPKLINGGRLCVDFYWKRIRTMLHAKYVFRPVTKRMDTEKLLAVLERRVPLMLKVSQVIGSIPGLGIYLKRLIPVADYTGRYPLTQQQLVEWAILDTFDMLAPEYDNPQSVSTVKRWYEETGFDNVEIFHEGHLVGRGEKKHDTGY